MPRHRYIASGVDLSPVATVNRYRLLPRGRAPFSALPLAATDASTLRRSRRATIATYRRKRRPTLPSRRVCAKRGATAASGGALPSAVLSRVSRVHSVPAGWLNEPAGGRGGSHSDSERHHGRPPVAARPAPAPRSGGEDLSSLPEKAVAGSANGRPQRQHGRPPAASLPAPAPRSGGEDLSSLPGRLHTARSDVVACRLRSR